jgi:hypothetical protein
LTPRTWWTALGALAAVRVAIPLAALASEGSSLPGLPAYRYEPIPGDAHAYYWAARELLAGVGRLNAVWPVLAAFLFAGALVAAYRLRRSPWAPLLPASAAALAVALLVVSEVEGSGAPSLGWPLAWSAGLAVQRALRFSIEPDSAFPVALALSLVANAVAVIALGVAGRKASARAGIGLLAAALFAVWPLIETLVAGPSARANATWLIETGLHMYSEPLSIALVLVSLALLLDAPRVSGFRVVWAGIAIGAATTVRVSNGLFAVAAVLVLLRQDGFRPAARYAAGALAIAPIALAYWPKGYPTLLDDPELFDEPPFALSYAARTWGDMAYLSPRALAVLVPLALLGALALRSRPTLPLLVLWALLEPAFYAFYSYTWTTPRFVLASLSVALVLVAAGVAAAAAAVGQLGRTAAVAPDARPSPARPRARSPDGRSLRRLLRRTRVARLPVRR